MKPQLHIVIFDGDLHPSTFVYRLAEGLSKLHKVSIMGFSGKPRPGIPNLSYVPLGSASRFPSLVLKSLSWSFTYFLKKGSPKPFLATLKNSIWLRKTHLQQQNFHLALALLRPDIVHVQWLSLLPWCEEILSIRMYKVVLSQRGYQVNVRPFVDVVNFEYLQQWYPKLSGFHSVSQAISVVGNTIWDAPKKIDHVVYSGFDFDTIPFREKYTKETTLKILSVGRPHWIKGYATALKACELLKKYHVPFQYTIIGAEKDEELLVLMDTYGISQHVHLLPKCSQDQVYQIMGQHDVLLFPSYQEGLPNVVVEAMAIGLPVVATQCGVEELWKESWDPLVPAYDSVALANALVAFSKKPLEAIEKQRLEARMNVLKQHASVKMVADMEMLYQKVMEQG